jgi:hypothetical protein
MVEQEKLGIPEDGSQGTPEREEALGAPRPEGEVSDRKFSGRATVNGIEIKVSYADDSMDYEVYLPQAESDNQIIKLSESSETASRVFEFAKEAAKTAKDINEFCSAVQDRADEEIGKEVSE